MTAALDLALTAAAGLWELAGHDSEVGARRLWAAQGLALSVLAAAVIADLVRERRARRALAALVVDLSGGSKPGSLRDAVVSRLGDPDVVLAFPVAAEAGLVDATGSPVDPGSRPTTELRHGGVHLATLVHGSASRPRPEAVDELVAAVHLGLENERLHAEALAQVADLRRSGARLLAVGDEERRALERDLHDGAQQRLVGLALGLQLLRVEAPERDLLPAERELRSAIEGLRQLGHGLYPVLLHDAGLGPALASLAETHDLRVDRVPDRRFPSAVETTVYLAVSRVAAHGASSVAAWVEDGALHGCVDGPVGAADLAEVADRVATLDGAVTGIDDNGSRQLVLEIPLDRGPGPAG
jgi:signal transduction histidine kinase